MSIKEKLIAIQTKLKEIKDSRGMNESQLEVFKQFNSLLALEDYKELAVVVGNLQNDPNWTLIKFSDVHCGMGESDVDEVYKFYAPTINQGLQISLNAYASHATIRKFTEMELRALELKKLQDSLTNLTDYESIEAVKNRLINDPEWQLLSNEMLVNGVDEIFEFYSETLSGGITIVLNAQDKTASIEKTSLSRLMELVYPEDAQKR